MTSSVHMSTAMPACSINLLAYTPNAAQPPNYYVLLELSAICVYPFFWLTGLCHGPGGGK